LEQIDRRELGELSMRKTWSKPKHDLLGHRFGRLVAIELVLRVDDTHGFSWKCRCDCGKEIVTRAQHLRAGCTKSCGCLFREKRAAGLKVTHGRTGTPEYEALHRAVFRCSPTCKQRADYYDRGISVCAKWKTLTKEAVEDFIAHVGPHPGFRYSLDRIDNDKGYEHGNVRWATKQEQTDNRRQPICKEKLSDAEFDIEAERRGYTKVPAAVVYKAVTISANAPTVGNVVLVDASK
jgi:hypothetical protein